MNLLINFLPNNEVIDNDTFDHIVDADVLEHTEGLERCVYLFWSQYYLDINIYEQLTTGIKDPSLVTCGIRNVGLLILALMTYGFSTNIFSLEK
jgi:hypothetical protein